MKKILSFTCVSILIFGTFHSCHSSPADEVQASPSDSSPATIERKQEPIETTVLQGKTFYQELAGNGKVTASRSAEVRFKTVERIAHVWVRNGQRVEKGQKLAELDKFRLERSLAQAKDNLEQSRLNLQDVLIGRGYSLEEINLLVDKGRATSDKPRVTSDKTVQDTSPHGHSSLVARSSSLPTEDFHLAAIKSGYNKALIAYELAAKELEQATLTAPFSGVVANLTAKADNLSSTGEPFCLVIDDAHPEVAFTVLESELPMVRPGYSVSVIPFAERDPQARVWGEVTEVNPYVESNGMVKVKARVSNNGRLIEGMNVKVTMRQPIGDRLVIPKSAVVMRSGKPVVFTLTRGKAQWNYVEVLAENSDSCTVAPRTKEYEGLSAGDTVIVKGNLNLAHDSEISYE